MQYGPTLHKRLLPGTMPIRRGLHLRTLQPVRPGVQSHSQLHAVIKYYLWAMSIVTFTHWRYLGGRITMRMDMSKRKNIYSKLILMRTSSCHHTYIVAASNNNHENPDNLFKATNNFLQTPNHTATAAIRFPAKHNNPHKSQAHRHPRHSRS